MKRTNVVWLGLLCLVGLGLSACATRVSTPYPPPGYAHRARTSHVELYYNCSKPSPGEMRLDGLAFNPSWSQPVRDLQFELVGMDGGNRSLSAARSAARDYQLFTNDSTPFQLDLKTVGGEVRFDLYFEYHFQEGDHKEFLLSSAGWPGIARLAAMTPNRNLVRDACSPDLHLAK